MPYRDDLAAARSHVERLSLEVADLRARLSRPRRDWLDAAVRAVLLATAGTVGALAWWVVTAG